MSEVYCPKCKVRVPVASSQRAGEIQVRYHYCKCGFKKTTTAPASKVWRRILSTIETKPATN